MPAGEVDEVLCAHDDVELRLRGITIGERMCGDTEIASSYITTVMFYYPAATKDGIQLY